MKKNMKSFTTGIRIFVVIAFSVLFISTVATKSLIQYQTLFQEKLLYIALSLVFFFIIHHKICSRVSYVVHSTGEGGEEQ
jgi:hypothetical protein